MTDFAAEREAMIDRQLRQRGITGKLILDAFLEVPRGTEQNRIGRECGGAIGIAARI